MEGVTFNLSAEEVAILRQAFGIMVRELSKAKMPADQDPPTGLGAFFSESDIEQE
jgi:hypothetical protein